MTDRKKLYVSLLPLVVIVLLIIGAGYFLLVDEIKLPWLDRGTRIRRIENFPTIVYTVEGQTAEKTRKVIKSDQELNEYLNAVDKSGLLTMREKIDFEKEYLIAVSSEIEKVDGHRMKVRKVYEDKSAKTLLVSILETYPGETCVLDVNPHVGVDIVAINKTDWAIDFERVKEVKECN